MFSRVQKTNLSLRTVKSFDLSGTIHFYSCGLLLRRGATILDFLLDAGNDILTFCVRNLILVMLHFIFLIRKSDRLSPRLVSNFGYNSLFSLVFIFISF